MNASFILSDEVSARRLWGFLKANWREMAQTETPLVVEVKPYKSKRSVEQNKYYWRLLGQISRDAWLGGKQFSSEAWHEFYKRLLIGMEELPGGQTAGISSASLSVDEFGDYINKVESHAINELGIELEQR